jgi:hypothetical protein
MEIETKLTDMEIALGLAGHILNPCSVVVRGQRYDIRDFYLRLARQTAPQLNDSYAINFLKSVIVQYE